VPKKAPVPCMQHTVGQVQIHATIPSDKETNRCHASFESLVADILEETKT
jgi:hypothetical protein